MCIIRPYFIVQLKYQYLYHIVTLKILLFFFIQNKMNTPFYT